MTELPNDDLSIAGVPVKCVVVGDAEVGKTCLMLAFVRQDSAFEYTPSSVDSYTVGMTVDSQKIVLFLQDTAGSESYDDIRPHCYAGSQVVVIVFSLLAESTLDNVISKWNNEVQTYARNCPILLVGTFSDLATDNSAQSEKAKRVAEQINAAHYLEVCSTSHSQATEVFTAAARIGAALSSQFKNSSSYLSLTLISDSEEVEEGRQHSKSCDFFGSDDEDATVLTAHALKEFGTLMGVPARSSSIESNDSAKSSNSAESPGKLLSKEVSSPHLLRRRVDLSTATRVETPVKECSAFATPEVPLDKKQKHLTSSLREKHSKKHSEDTDTSLSSEKKSHSIGTLEHSHKSSEEKHGSSLRISVTSVDEKPEEGKKKNSGKKLKRSPKTPKRHKRDESNDQDDGGEPKKLTRDTKSPSEPEIKKSELHRTESTPYVLKSIVPLDERKWKARSMMPSMIDIVAAQPRLPKPQLYDASPSSGGSPMKSPLGTGQGSVGSPGAEPLESGADATPMAVEEVIRSPTLTNLKPKSPKKDNPKTEASEKPPSVKGDEPDKEPPSYPQSTRTLLEQCITSVSIAVSQNPLFNVWIYRGIGLTLTAEPWGESTEHYLLKIKTRADKCRMYFLNERNKKAFKTLVGPGSLLAVQDSSRFFVLNLPVPIGLGFKSHDESGRFVVEYMKKMYEARNYKGKRSVFFRRKSGDRSSLTHKDEITQPVPVSQDGRQSPFASQPDLDVYETLEGHFVAAMQHNSETQTRQKPSDSDEKRKNEHDRAVNTAIAAAKPILRSTVSQASLVSGEQGKVNSPPKEVFNHDVSDKSSPKNSPRDKSSPKNSPRDKSSPKVFPSPRDRSSPKVFPSPRDRSIPKSTKANRGDVGERLAWTCPHQTVIEKPSLSRTWNSSSSSVSPSPSNSPCLHSTTPKPMPPPEKTRSSSKMKRMDDHFTSSAMKRTARSIRGTRARNDLLHTSVVRGDEMFQALTLTETRRVLERLMVQHSDLTVFSPCLNNAYYEEDSSSSDDDSELTSPIIEPLAQPSSHKRSHKS